MPYAVQQTLAAQDLALERPGHGLPRLRYVLTPYKSLTPKGFVWFISITAVMIAVPLISVIGTSVFWPLLPFVIAPIWGIWICLKRSWRDMDLYEVVTIWDDLVRIERHEARRETRDWEDHPYRVRLRLHDAGGPVPKYLTLVGQQREVELGAFLTPGERMELKSQLERDLRPI